LKHRAGTASTFAHAMRHFGLRAAYTRRVFDGVQTRMLPVVNRASDYAPIAPACCNACRVCATSGIVGLVFAAGGAVAAFAARLAQRVAPPP
jgi:hypothetical protein